MGFASSRVLNSSLSLIRVGLGGALRLRLNKEDMGCLINGQKAVENPFGDDFTANSRIMIGTIRESKHQFDSKSARRKKRKRVTLQLFSILGKELPFLRPIIKKITQTKKYIFKRKIIIYQSQ